MQMWRKFMSVVILMSMQVKIKSNNNISIMMLKQLNQTSSYQIKWHKVNNRYSISIKSMKCQEIAIEYQIQTCKLMTWYRDEAMARMQKW